MKEETLEILNGLTPQKTNDGWVVFDYYFAIREEYVPNLDKDISYADKSLKELLGNLILTKKVEIKYEEFTITDWNISFYRVYELTRHSVSMVCNSKYLFKAVFVDVIEDILTEKDYFKEFSKIILVDKENPRAYFLAWIIDNNVVALLGGLSKFYTKYS